MSLYLGPFYFDKREIFLLILIILLSFCLYQNYELPLFKAKNLLVLASFLLFAKALVPSSRNTALYLTFVLALLFTLFWPFFLVVFFILTALLLLKIFRLV